MNETQRKEILDLLAQGKISIDETVQMLSEEDNLPSSSIDEPVHKVDISTNSPDEIGSEKDQKVEKSVSGENRPKWLRIKVSNLENGKNKVSINIPFGLVEFGIGIANVFSPPNDQFKFDRVKEFVAASEPGILIDVEDNDSNEHVKVFLD